MCGCGGVTLLGQDERLIPHSLSEPLFGFCLASRPEASSPSE